MSLEKILEVYSEIINRFEKKTVLLYGKPVPIQTPFDIGPALTTYYSNLKFTGMPTIGNALHLMIFSDENIETAQSGWFWIRDKGGNVIENGNWKRSWVVFALRDGDALFVDAQSTEGKVFGSIQKKNFFISDSLEKFLLTYIECLGIEDDFHREVMDEDFNYKEEFLSCVTKIAENHLGNEGRSGFMKLFFG